MQKFRKRITTGGRGREKKLVQQVHFGLVAPAGLVLVFDEENFEVGLVLMVHKIDLDIGLVFVVHKEPFTLVSGGLILIVFLVHQQVRLVLIINYIDLHIGLVLIVGGVVPF